MNESSMSSVFKIRYDSIGDVERVDVSVMDDVISAHGGYKQCHLTIDEICLSTVTFITMCIVLM